MAMQVSTLLNQLKILRNYLLVTKSTVLAMTLLV